MEHCLRYFQVKRIPYETKPACSISQYILEKVFQGCPGVMNYLDDIVVTGEHKEEHLNNLYKVLERLEKAGFSLNFK